MSKHALIIVALLLSALVAHAEIYRWTDATSATTPSSRNPQKVSPSG